NGHRERSHSSATHRQATHSGAQRSRCTSGSAAPRSTQYAASAADSSSHGAGPTALPVQDSSGTKNVTPKISPCPAPQAGPRPCTTRLSSATATGARGQNPYGGNARKSSPPAAADSMTGYPPKTGATDACTRLDRLSGARLVQTPASHDRATAVHAPGTGAGYSPLAGPGPGQVARRKPDGAPASRQRVSVGGPPNSGNRGQAV